LNQNNTNKLNLLFKNVGNCEKYPDEDVWSLLDDRQKDGNSLLAFNIETNKNVVEPEKEFLSVMFEGSPSGHTVRCMHFIAFLPVDLVIRATAMKTNDRDGFFNTLYRYGYEELQKDGQRWTALLQTCKGGLNHDRIYI
jgi:hypothetical protein